MRISQILGHAKCDPLFKQHIVKRHCAPCAMCGISCSISAAFLIKSAIYNVLFTNVMVFVVVIVVKLILFSRIIIRLIFPCPLIAMLTVILLLCSLYFKTVSLVSFHRV